MLTVSKLRIAIITTVIAVSAYLSMPSLIPSLKNRLVFSDKTINLGLDLRGGASLLLELDFDAYERDQAIKYHEYISNALRQENIRVDSISTQNFEYSVMADKVEDFNAIKKILKSVIGQPLEFYESDNKLTATFSANTLRNIKDGLINQSIEIVRKRVDESATKEIDLMRQGDKYILLQVPGLENPDVLKSILGRTAKLTFHFLDMTVSPENFLQGGGKVGLKVLPFDSKKNALKQLAVIESKPLLSGDMLLDAQTSVSGNGQVAVAFKLNNTGAKIFADITKNGHGKLLAIVLDNKIISAPKINEPILGGSGQIVGNFSIETANELALLLRAGALPVPLKVVEERTVGPSLGQDSILAGTRAAVIGTILVLVFMFLFYGVFGMVANLALILNLLMLISVMIILNATLTLPGIAAMVLTLGMAVDANVLIYERIREEMAKGRTPLSAIDTGFKMAFSTILDSNITTILAALVLFVFGSGPIKGFGITLAIGIICSMFSAVTFSRTIIAIWYKKTLPKKIWL